MSVIKRGFGTVLRNWPTLICFEIFYKVMGSELLSGLIYMGRTAVLKASGFSDIGQGNVGQVFRHPVTVLLLMAGLLLCFFYVYLEIMALLIYCEAGWRGERISVWKLCREALIRSIQIFHYKNLPVLLLLMPVIALSGFPLTNGILRAVQIPEYIRDFIKASPVLTPVFLSAAAGLNVLLFFYLFSFPAVAVQKVYFIGSLRNNLALLRGRRLKTLGCLALCLAASGLLLLAGFCGVIFLMGIFSKGLHTADGGESLFLFYYVKWRSVGAILADILITLTLWAAVVTLYHQYRKDEPPVRKSVPKNGKNILLPAGRELCLGRRIRWRRWKGPLRQERKWRK